MHHTIELDWKVRLLTWLLSLSKPANEMTPQEVEQMTQTPISLVGRVMLGQSLPLPKITNLVIPGRHGDIGLRLYYPMGQSVGVIAFFHGGGWISGNFQTHDAMCRRLARESGVLVIAVGYRLLAISICDRIRGGVRYPRVGLFTRLNL